MRKWKALFASGAHNPERATSKRWCHGVFTDQFIYFQKGFGGNLEYLLNSDCESVQTEVFSENIWTLNIYSRRDYLGQQPCFKKHFAFLLQQKNGRNHSTNYLLSCLLSYLFVDLEIINCKITSSMKTALFPCRIKQQTNCQLHRRRSNLRSGKKDTCMIAG